MSTFLKQVLIIGNKTYNSASDELVTELGLDFSGTFDMDSTSGILSFKLPYIDSANEKNFQNSDVVTFKNIIKKWVPIRLYAKMLPTNEKTSINLHNDGKLDQMFEGVVLGIRISRSKTDYNFDIECIGTLSYVGNEFKLPIGSALLDFTGTQYFDNVIKQAGATALINTSTVLRNVSGKVDTTNIKWTMVNNLSEIFNSVREDFGIRVHQQGNGIVNIFDLLYYFDQTTDNSQTLAWEYVLGQNMFNIDYGDLTTDVQMVEVVGNGDIGYAIDPTGMSLKATQLGKSEDDPTLYNKITIYRPDIVGKDELELAGKNHLLELMQNNIITFQAPLNTKINVGDFITVDDGELYSNQAMIVKGYTFNISKSDVAMTITAYRSVLATQPQSLIVSKSGITDTELIKVTKEIEDLNNWNSFVSV